jgi:hypothetical protein
MLVEFDMLCTHSLFKLKDNIIGIMNNMTKSTLMSIRHIIAGVSGVVFSISWRNPYDPNVGDGYDVHI